MQHVATVELASVAVASGDGSFHVGQGRIGLETPGGEARTRLRMGAVKVKGSNVPIPRGKWLEITRAAPDLGIDLDSETICGMTSYLGEDGARDALMHPGRESV